MALYFNNQPQSRSAMLGSAIGSGLGQGIEQLAQQKLENLNKQFQVKQTAGALLERYPELGEKGARAIATLPPELQKQAYKGLEESRFMKEQQQYRDKLNTTTPPGIGAAPEGSEGEQSPMKLSAGEKYKQKVGLPRNAAEAAKINSDAAKLDEKEQIAQTAAERTEKAARYKSAGNYESELAKKISAGHEELTRIKLLEDLSEKGDIDDPRYLAGLESLGLSNLKFLKKTDTQKYDKIRADFVTNAKNTFPGGRMTDTDLKLFFDRIPDLLNSKDGRKEIFKIYKTLLQARNLEAEEYENLLEENKGVPPYGAELKVARRIGPKIEQLTDKFLKQTGIERGQENMEVGSEHEELPDLKKVKNAGKSYNPETQIIATPDYVNNKWIKRKATPEEIKKYEGEK